MAFIDIKNPKERDKIVQDYIQTINRVREKTEDEKAEGMRRKVEIEKVFTPIVEATKESTSKITEEMKKSRATNESEKEYWEKDFAKSAIDYYLNIKKNKDMYFGIQKTDDGYEMGDKKIQIDKDSNITIDDHTYKATTGLWGLIMLNSPPKDLFTSSDYIEYEDIVYRTQAIFNPITKKSSDKPKMTVKYRTLLKPMLEHYEGVDEDEDGDEEEIQTGDKPGKGIQYLPGNINGLLDRLKLLYAEREAGNINATNNEIVGILDELLRMKYLSRTQYNMVCKSLQC